MLVACDPTFVHFEADIYCDKVEYVELVRYDNDNFKIVNGKKTTLKFDRTKAIQIEILDDSKLESFLLDFEEIIFSLESSSTNEPSGYCLLWHLNNGNFIVFSITCKSSIGCKSEIAYSMAAEFDSESNFIKHYANWNSEDRYESLLKKYFKNYNY